MRKCEDMNRYEVITFQDIEDIMTWLIFDFVCLSSCNITVSPDCVIFLSFPVCLLLYSIYNISSMGTVGAALQVLAGPHLSSWTKTFLYNKH